MSNYSKAKILRQPRNNRSTYITLPLKFMQNVTLNIPNAAKNKTTTYPVLYNMLSTCKPFGALLDLWDEIQLNSVSCTVRCISAETLATLDAFLPLKITTAWDRNGNYVSTTNIYNYENFREIMIMPNNLSNDNKTTTYLGAQGVLE